MTTARPSTESRDLTRRWLTLVTLVAFSAAMVYGTWLAVDDMGAKPMAGDVRLAGDALRVVNTSDFAWIDVRMTIDGVYVAPVEAGPVTPGGELRVTLARFVDASGRTPPTPREVAIAVTRVPRFPKVNRARTASGTWLLR